MFDIAARDVYCSTINVAGIRNTSEILVLTAVNHSETDWNIRHAFRIWAYTDYFGSPTTPLMSVFGVRSECAETKKNNKKSEIAKKNLGRGDFGGSVGAQQTDKILRMALLMLVSISKCKFSISKVTTDSLTGVTYDAI